MAEPAGKMGITWSFSSKSLSARLHPTAPRPLRRGRSQGFQIDTIYEERPVNLPTFAYQKTNVNVVRK